MSELGTHLKKARIAKGYGLEDLQELTKIQKRYLAGIEDGNYNIMPGPFYARAFIKQYAEAVGLNSTELFEQYKPEVPAAASEEMKPLAMTSARSQRQSFAGSSSNRLGEVMPMIIVALFIIVIIAVAWFFYQQLGDDQAEEITEDGGVLYEESTDSGSAGEFEEEPAEEPAVKEPVEEANLSLVGTEGETTTYSWTGPAAGELQIDASGASWVSATDENQQELMSPARELQANETETIDVSGASRVRVRIGAVPNITLTLNGESIDYTQDRITQNIVIQFAASE